MSRIAGCFARLAEAGRKALIPYIVAGDPGPEVTVELMHRLVAEGADILMVKPAGAYLDIIRELRDRSSLPIAAYQVSGEYAQIMAAGERGWLDVQRTRYESLLAIKRAGANMIFSYFAKAIAQDLT